MAQAVAIVAAACEYPDARSPNDLWEVSLFGRQAFRRLPSSRLSLTQYLRGDVDPDGLYEIEAALIEGYSFDRERFLVPLATFRSTDLSHWLALDVASRAISSLPPDSLETSRVKDRTGVVIANTLTGEFSRSALLRYRWPFIEHQVRTAAHSFLASYDLERFLGDLEQQIKAPFPDPDSDSLAGGLSNTIAGRIANHFGFRGGAHAVDGACASSLVGIVTACERLRSGELDCAVVGAVDLSLDPFELVGFARNGALARKEMRVFDRDSEGFWPGEGCGVVVLATKELAERLNWQVLGWIRGTGMSGDGHGGLTRPTTSGQLLALQRAWAMAKVAPSQADYFETHGTGTPTGDPIELLALAKLVSETRTSRPIPVGTVKTNIGHTKAAAGMAGLIKALSIARHRIVPPTAGHYNAHTVLVEEDVREALRVPTVAESINHDRPLWMGINSFGFGGINCHIVVQGGELDVSRPRAVPKVSVSALRAELITFSAPNHTQLLEQIEQTKRLAVALSRAELQDLAAAHRPTNDSEWRAYVVAPTPRELETRAEVLINSLRSDTEGTVAVGENWAWTGSQMASPRLAFLFSGQAVTAQADLSPWVARFPWLSDFAERIVTREESDTAALQAFLAEVGIASIDLLGRFGLQPHSVLGHSFGELSALCAAGAIDQSTFRTLAARRGRAMNELSAPGGMLAVAIDRSTANALAKDFDVDVACWNAPDRHVLSGSQEAIAHLKQHCDRVQFASSLLPTDRAFHSRLMRDAQSTFSEEISSLSLGRPTIPVASTVTGGLLSDEPLQTLLTQQFTAPVRFNDAISALGEVDLLIELGAAAGLSGLVSHLNGPRCVSVPTFAGSLEPLLHAVGVWWILGGRVNCDVLFDNRHFRPFHREALLSFFTNPCSIDSDAKPVIRKTSPAPYLATSTQDAPATTFKSADPLEQLKLVIAEITDLPKRAVGADSKLLADLHLNSLRARHVVATTARRLGLQSLPFNLGDISSATVGEVASLLDSLLSEQSSGLASKDAPIPGVEVWLAALSHRWEATTEPHHTTVKQKFRLEGLPFSPPDAFDELLSDAPDAPRLLYLGDTQSERVLEILAASVDEAEKGLLVLQTAQLANGFAQSLAKEFPAARICVVELEELAYGPLGLAIDEFTRLPRGYSELRLKAGRVQRRVPKVLPIQQQGPLNVITHDDVVLVTGGAKGIGAATAALIARTYGCRVVLVGRSSPNDTEVLATLSVVQSLTPACFYVQADLTVPSECTRLVDAVFARFGTVSVLIHSAGTNVPTSASELTPELMTATVAAKARSLEHLLGALPANQLKLLISYSSIIGELGLPGESHYALSNEWMAERTRAYARVSPRTRCLPIAWSAWREVGMAARMEGVLEGLANADARALATGEALETLQALIESNHGGETIIVTGRYGRLVDTATDLRTLQGSRYLETPRIYYPGIELVADCEISTDTDRYLSDHAPFGVPVFPLVAAIEAMLSAGKVLQPKIDHVRMDDLCIGDAITLRPGERAVLRTSAVRRNDGIVVVDLRSSLTEFKAVHFSARLTYQETNSLTQTRSLPGGEALAAHPLIYSGLCFHGPRFQRVAGFHKLTANHCVAGLKVGASQKWFGPLHPQRLEGGEPTSRDALLHALQGCIPHQPILPVGADSVELGALDSNRSYFLMGEQTFGDGDSFKFDVDVCDECGLIVERWRGLRLARVTSSSVDLSIQMNLDVGLLEAYVGRLLLDELKEREWTVGVCPWVDSESSQQAVQRSVGFDVALIHDANGHPVIGERFVSISHTDLLTMAVTHATKKITCDIEHHASLEQHQWRLMLGDRRWNFVCDLERMAPMLRETGALIVWTASECLSKLGCEDWPFEIGKTRVSVAPYTGPLVRLESKEIRIAVGLLRMFEQAHFTSVAVGVSDLPAAALTVQGLVHGTVAGIAE